VVKKGHRKTILKAALRAAGGGTAVPPAPALAPTKGPAPGPATTTAPAKGKAPAPAPAVKEKEEEEGDEEKEEAAPTPAKKSGFAAALMSSDEDEEEEEEEQKIPAGAAPLEKIPAGEDTGGEEVELPSYDFGATGNRRSGPSALVDSFPADDDLPLFFWGRCSFIYIRLTLNFTYTLT